MRGYARVGIVSANGDEALLARIAPGECFGEMAMLDGRPRSATVTAKGTTRAFAVGHAKFEKWLSKRPEAAMALLETLSLRLRQTDQSLMAFFLDVPHRLAERLVARSEGMAQAEVRMTPDQTAADLGVTRESVNKALKQFRDAGWIRTGRGFVAIAPRFR